METLIEHLSAEKIDKDTNTAEENGQTQKIELETGGKDELTLGHCAGLPAMNPGQFVLLKFAGNVILPISIFAPDKTVFFVGFNDVWALPVRFAEFFEDLFATESGSNTI